MLSSSIIPRTTEMGWSSSHPRTQVQKYMVYLTQSLIWFNPTLRFRVDQNRLNNERVKLHIAIYNLVPTIILCSILNHAIIPTQPYWDKIRTLSTLLPDSRYGQLHLMITNSNWSFALMSKVCGHYTNGVFIHSLICQTYLSYNQAI